VDGQKFPDGWIDFAAAPRLPYVNEKAGVTNMSDVVVNLGVERPRDELVLASAIEAYAKWRQYMCNPEERHEDSDAPDIMVKTRHGGNGVVTKTLIFQERRWAAAFLRIWRSERRRKT
jgi:hypothetical protein